jgi:hypothetical protein
MPTSSARHSTASRRRDGNGPRCDGAPDAPRRAGRGDVLSFRPPVSLPKSREHHDMLGPSEIVARGDTWLVTALRDGEATAVEFLVDRYGRVLAGRDPGAPARRRARAQGPRGSPAGLGPARSRRYRGAAGRAPPGLTRGRGAGIHEAIAPRLRRGRFGLVRLGRSRRDDPAMDEVARPPVLGGPTVAVHDGVMAAQFGIGRDDETAGGAPAHRPSAVRGAAVRVSRTGSPMRPPHS